MICDKKYHKLLFKIMKNENFDNKHNQMQKTRYHCFGCTQRNMTLHEAQTDKYECTKIAATYLLLR